MAAATPMATYKRLLGYTARYWKFLLIGIIGVIIDGLAQPIFVKLTEPLIDRVFTAKDAAFGLQLAGIVAALGLARVVGNFVGVFGMEWVGRKITADMRQELFNSYLRLPTSFFDQHSAGNLISRLSYNSEQVAHAATTTIVSAFRDVITVTGFFAAMLITNVYLTMSVLIIIPLIALIVGAVSRRFRKISHRIQDSMGDISHVTEEAVSGHKVIKIFAGQEQEANRFATVNDKTRRLSMRLVRTRLMSSSLIQIAAITAMVMIILVAIRPSILETISAGMFNVIFLAMVASIPPLKRLIAVQEQLGKGIAAAHSLFAVMDRPQEQDSGTADTVNIRGEIEFKQLSFSYPEQDDLALNDISFIVPAGKVTALVGHSGSGKTTLAGLIPRFYAYTDGHILLDDYELSDYRLTDLRKQISLVSQDVVLFNDTVAANIAYGSLEGTSEKAIIAAAESAHALEFIQQLPDGFSTLLGKSGVGLSGGQRQRIAIARALLKNTPILILDEATSALDNESERAIQAALNEVMRGRTTLVIAHRLSTIESADQIVVLHHGRVAEIGTHATLLAQQGIYASLYQTEFTSRAS